MGGILGSVLLDGLWLNLQKMWLKTLCDCGWSELTLTANNLNIFHIFLDKVKVCLIYWQHRTVPYSHILKQD